MEAWVSKVLALLGLFILTVLPGLLPIWLMKICRVNLEREGSGYGGTTRILSALNSFAGGVFLGTTFLHLFPEMRVDMNDWLEQANIHIDFPLPEVIVCFGFLLILTIEHVLMTARHRQLGAVNCKSFDHTCLPTESSSLISSEVNISNVTKYGSSHNTPEIKCEHGKQEEEQNTSSDKPAVISSSRHGNPRIVNIIDDSNSNTGFKEIEKYDTNNAQTGHAVERERSVNLIREKNKECEGSEMNEIQGLRSLTLMLALSVHTVFEGLALGLQQTAAGAWTLFSAIAIHKTIIAFSLSLQLTRTVKSRFRHIAFIIVFAVMCPLGALAGLLVDIGGSGLAVEATSAILQAVATGTFIHVTFFEVLQREVGQTHNLLNVLSVILGFSLMVIVTIFLPHDH